MLGETPSEWWSPPLTFWRKDAVGTLVSSLPPAAEDPTPSVLQVHWDFRKHIPLCGSYLASQMSWEGFGGYHCRVLSSTLEKHVENRTEAEQRTLIPPSHRNWRAEGLTMTVSTARFDWIAIPPDCLCFLPWPSPCPPWSFRGSKWKQKKSTVLCTCENVQLKSFLRKHDLQGRSEGENMLGEGLFWTNAVAWGRGVLSKWTQGKYGRKPLT